jgi:hypothetical protein
MEIRGDRWRFIETHRDTVENRRDTIGTQYSLFRSQYQQEERENRNKAKKRPAQELMQKAEPA